VHYFAFVLFEPDEWRQYASDIRNVVRERIRRYHREMEVPEYRPPCRCMGTTAYRAAGIAFLCRGRSDVPSEFWVRLGFGLRKPDPACTICGGSGLELRSTTLNPDGQYDYWRLWSFEAWLANKSEFDDLDSGFGPVSKILSTLDDEEKSPANHLAKLPSAIVTPNGLWFAQSPSTPPEAWVTEARLLLEKYCDCTAVAIDCHA
jgi:hypothetical protein